MSQPTLVTSTACVGSGCSLAMRAACTLVIPPRQQIGVTRCCNVVKLSVAGHIALSCCYHSIHIFAARSQRRSDWSVRCKTSGSQLLRQSSLSFGLLRCRLWHGHCSSVVCFSYDKHLVLIVSAITAGVSVCVLRCVHMTHSEGREVSAEVVVLEDSGDCLCSRRSDGGRVDGNCKADIGKNENRRSTSTLLVASFCTNRLHDSFVNTPGAKRDNGEAVRDLQWRSARAAATATSFVPANCRFLIDEQGH